MAAYEFGPFRLDLAEHCLMRNGQLVTLPKRPFEVLALLVANKGHLITKDELMRKIWADMPVEESNLTVSMSKIRKVLGESKRRQRYIATVPCRGYRFIANVRTVQEGRIDSIAVLPFENKHADPDAAYIAEGLTESLIYSLSRLRNLRVIPRISVVHYKGKAVDPRKVAKKLGVSSVLSGRISVRGENLIVSTELSDARSNELLWGEQHHRKISDLLTTQRNITRQITENLKLTLKLKLSRAVQRRAVKRPESNEAYQLYLRGRYYWNKRSEEDLKKSVEYFKQAIKTDPGYALSYAGLADAYNILGFYSILAPGIAFSRAKAAALRALEIDGSLAEAHAALGYAKLYYDWDWPGAEQSFKQSIRLDPNCASAHHFYANQLTVMGSFDEAIAEFKHALDIDCLSLITNAALGYCYYFARRYDEAIEQCETTTEMDRHFELAHLWLGWAYQQKGRWEEAIIEYQKARALSGGRAEIIAVLGTAYAVSGKRTQAQEALASVAKLAKQRYISPYRIACIHTALGESDKAFEFLERAFKHRSHFLIGLKIDPSMDALRDDPRFISLGKRVGLP